MADNKILLELDIVQKGDKLQLVGKQLDSTTKKVDKYGQSQQKLAGKVDNTNKKEKALYQTNLSSAKGFSKLNQTIGGSSGSGALVGSYAILAANVFAVTAAFNTLRQAAGVDKLAEGLRAFSNTTGQSLDIVAKRLQETTGFAVSFEQAMRTAALSTSAGFGVTEMEGLTRVAKGASLALGRDMGDALDRLTRGAIKLEPEILDELGIMVRLDDATESYAATLGKSAAQLTRFERQQAFMNAIITEGEAKFGAIADTLDPNAYDTLSAAFADLSKNILTVLNTALIPLINFMIKAPGVFIGAVGIFGGSITKRMLPALGDLSIAAKKSAQAALDSIDSFVAMGGAAQQAARDGINTFDGAPKVFQGLIGPLKQGTASAEQLTSAQRSLGVSLSALTKKQKALEAEGKKLSAQDAKRLKNLSLQKSLVDQLAASQVKANILRKQAFAQANLAFAEKEIELMAVATRETFGFQDAFKKVGEIGKGVAGAVKAYNLSLKESGLITSTNNIATKAYIFSLKTLKVTFKAVALSAKAFGAALLQAIPIIGQIILIGSLLFEALKGIAKLMGFFTEESRLAKEANEDLDKVIGGIEDKMKTMADQQERATETSTTMIDRYKILGGLAKSVADETFRAQQALENAGEFDRDKTFSSRGGLGGIFGQEGSISEEQAISRTEEDSPVIRSLAGLEEKSEDTAKLIQAQLGTSLGGFLKAAITGGKTLGEITDELAPILVLTEEVFGGVAESAAGMKTSFTEGEKEAGKFVRTLTQTTKYDGLATTFATLSNDLEAISREAAQAGADPVDFIADAVTGLGKNVTQLLGEDVVKASQTASGISQELIKQRQALLKETDPKKREMIETNILNLTEKYKKSRREIAKLVESELPNAKNLVDTIKQQSATIQEETKFIQQRSKATLAVAKNEFTILAAKKAQDAIDTKKKTLLTNELKLTDGALALIEAKRAKHGADVELTKEENELLARRAELEKQIETLGNSILANSLEEAESKIAGLRATEKQLALQKELNNLTVSNLEKSAKLNAIRNTGSATLTGGDQATVGLETAKKTFEFAQKDAELKFKIIEAEFELLQARVTIEKQINQKRINEINDINDAESIALNNLNNALDSSVQTAKDNLDIQSSIYSQTLIGSAADAEIAFNSLFSNIGNTFTSSGGGLSLANALTEATGKPFVQQLIEDADKKIDALTTKKDRTDAEDAELTRLKELRNELQNNLPSAIEQSAQAFSTMGSMIASIFGEEGVVASSLAFLASTTLNNFESISEGFTAFKDKSAETETEIKERNDSIAEGLQGLGNIIGSLGALSAASGKQRVSAIDDEIAAEKKRDGKSKESLEKIAQLEKKKEALEKKNFERNKKIQMASIVVNTAAGIMKTIGQTGFFGIPLALIIGAMGAAQLAMVAGTSFQGSGGAIQQPNNNTSLTIGKRSNAVDVSQATTSGELNYLRGGRTTGSGLGGAGGGFPGAAMGRKGYADGGVVVGERGPEVITPTTNVDVTPNYALGGGQTNVNFSINAIDAAGVEDVLMNQRGNIIRMIREAANDHGEMFLEDIDTQTYGSST